MKIRDLEPVLWVLLAPAIPYLGMKGLISGLIAWYGRPQDIPLEVQQGFVFVSPVFPLVLGLAAWVRLRKVHDGPDEAVRTEAVSWGRDLVSGLSVGWLCVAIALTSLRLLSNVVEVPALHAMPGHVHLYFMTVGAVIPGVAEELMYRGVVLRTGASWPRPAIGLTSALGFALWHIATPVYLPHTFVMGCLLAWLTFRAGGRLRPAMIAHICANATMGAVMLTGWVRL